MTKGGYKLNNPMSNSTQNDHETHNVCNERLEREGGKATCCDCDTHEGCTLGMNLYPGKFIPVNRLPEASKTKERASGEDWKIEFYEKFSEDLRGTGLQREAYIKQETPAKNVVLYMSSVLFEERIKLLADARREVIKKVEKMKKNGWDLSKIDYGFIDQGYNQAIDDVLATLREEES